MNLQALNSGEQDSAHAALMACCSCRRWADEVMARAPFSELDELFETAQQTWLNMSESDLLEAFAAHPKIGDLDALRDKYGTAVAEQGQVREAQMEVLSDLKTLNEVYEQRHGFIFIVCATGKSASEMCELLRQRLDNSRDQELANAAKEQGKIMALRMQQGFSAA